MSGIADRRSSLHARLRALSPDEIAPPHVDPQIAARAALAVVDFARTEGEARFAELAALDGFDLASLDEIDALAHALLGVVEIFDAAPRSPKPITVPQALEVESRARRGQLAALLSLSLPERPSVVGALRHLRLSYGPIDLALDLRALAAHVDHYAIELRGSDEFDAELADATRRLARQLEEILYSADTPELREARGALHRAWTLFERSYREVAAIGRELFDRDAEALFPPLEAIAEVTRTARRGSSSSRPAAQIVEEVLPSSRRLAHAPPRRPSSRGMPAARPTAATRPLSLEVMLHATSESNLYLGFSQDVAEGGLFVATYETRPIGAPVELTILLDQGDPVTVSGHVQWARPHGSGDDSLPCGLGVRLAEVSPKAASRLQSFAARRTPIFYDD